MTPQQTKHSREHEWAVILAGGDGTRLKSLTRKIAGDERPKQFCRVLGGATLLEETRRRAVLEMAPERTVYVVNQKHEPYYAPILGDETADNLVIQPRNASTALAILYSLLRIRALDPAAIVALFPSDHYVSDNQKFMAHVRTELDAAGRQTDLVILLGVEPESAEVEYGWIEPTGSPQGHARVFGVRRFWEKPNPVLAQVLQLRGCLWNSFVMIASARALIEMIEIAAPDLYRDFARVSSLLGTEAEAKAIDILYDRLQEVNFSYQVLSRCPGRLTVLKSHRRMLERSRRTPAGNGIARACRRPAPLAGRAPAPIRSLAIKPNRSSRSGFEQLAATSL
jgi:mannose-1-phosphate guanylyltransferase